MMLDKVLSSIMSSMPEGLSEDMRNNVKAVINNKLQQMDIVTREQFDVQKKILMRTREKVDELEIQVAQLEAKLNQEQS